MAVGTTNVSLGAVRTEMSKSLSNVSLARTVQNGYLESGSWVVANGLNQTTASATRGPLDTGSYGTGNSFFNLRRFAGYNHANIRFKYDPQYATASVGGVGNIRDTYGPTTGSDPANFTFNYQSASWTTGQANIISGSMQGFGATGWFRPLYAAGGTSSMGYIDFDGANDYVWWTDTSTGTSYKSYSGSANSSSLSFMFWIRVDANTGGPIRTVWANNTSPTIATNYGGVRFMISGGGATANRAIMSYGSAQNTTAGRFFTSSYFLTNAQWYCICMGVNGGTSLAGLSQGNYMFITPRTSASADTTNRVGNASGSGTYLGWVGGSDARMVWGLDRNVGYFNGAIGSFVMRPGPFTTAEYQQFFNAWRAATPA